MDADEEDRIVTALRAASSKLFRGVSDRVDLCREAASLLGWKRVTKKKWEMLDHGYRLALHRKVWLRQSEGAKGPYPYADARPIARYTKPELQALGEEALKRSTAPASEAECAVILAHYLGFATVLPEELEVLAAAVAKVSHLELVQKEINTEDPFYRLGELSSKTGTAITNDRIDAVVYGK